MIFKQSAICRGSETVSHVRNPSSILPAGTGESGKMTFASEGFILLRLAGPFITCSLALASTSAIAQAGATPPSPSGEAAAQRTEGREQPASAPSVANELCPSLEQAAAENGLPFDFLSASYGKKVASTRWRSAPRALKALRNSCRQLPIGAGSVIHSM
jgi:hypothetical protein